MKAHYTIISSKNPEGLINGVNTLIKVGYEPVGGMVVSCTYGIETFYQPMFKKERIILQ